MKELSNTEAELKKSVAYKKGCILSGMRQNKEQVDYIFSF